MLGRRVDVEHLYRLVRRAGGQPLAVEVELGVVLPIAKSVFHVEPSSEGTYDHVLMLGLDLRRLLMFSKCQRGSVDLQLSSPWSVDVVAGGGRVPGPGRLKSIMAYSEPAVDCPDRVEAGLLAAMASGACSFFALSLTVELILSDSQANVATRSVEEAARRHHRRRSGLGLAHRPPSGPVSLSPHSPH